MYVCMVESFTRIISAVKLVLIVIDFLQSLSPQVHHYYGIVGDLNFPLALSNKIKAYFQLLSKPSLSINTFSVLCARNVYILNVLHNF